MSKTVECGDSLSIEDIARLPEESVDLPLVLIASNKKMAAQMRKEYPGVKVIMQKKVSPN